MVQKTQHREVGNPPRVILYCGSDPATQENAFYFLNLFWKMMVMGRERGWTMIPVMDSRSFTEVGVPPQEISTLLKEGVDGIIGVMLYESMVAWIEECGVAHAALWAKSSLTYDSRQLVDLAFCRLAELGCKSAGLIIPGQMANASFLEHMDGVARELRLKVNYEWILVSRKSGDLNGYNHFCSLWEMRKRPDGLLVYPDIVARGIVTASLEKGARIPRDLKLILHRNEEMLYSVPMPCDWIESSGAAMAEAILRQLEIQWNGVVPDKVSLPFRLIKGY